MKNGQKVLDLTQLSQIIPSTETNDISVSTGDLYWGPGQIN